MRAATQIALAAGLLSGLLFASVLGGSAFVLLQYLAQLPLLAVGLAFGAAPALVSSAVATVVTFFLGWTSGLIFLAVYALPSVLVTREALLSRPGPNGAQEWYPPGELVAWITAYALAALILAGVLLSGQGGLEALARDFVRQLSTVIFGQEGSPAEQTLVDNAFLFPALIGVSWIIMVTINSILAQRIVTAMGRASRPTPNYVALRLPDWSVYLMVAAGVAWMVGGSIGFFGGAALIILLTPFFLQGLAVIHCMIPPGRTRPWVLGGFYLLLVMLLWLTTLVAILGVAEQWLRLRDRRGIV